MTLLPAVTPNSPVAPHMLSPWLPDQGDGTYRNPILFADYSDPDAIRVGDDYWMTSSSFCHVPGLPILHSRDLVNWTLVNHALPRLLPLDHFSAPHHGHGVWAPAIRFHAGNFWIFYPDPDFGIYVITTRDPRDKWSDPILIKAGKGLIDPCPLWDADGTGYLVHAWAKSRSGIKNRITLHRLRADNLAVADEGRIIIDGDQMPGWTTIEGPKLYRRDGYYYVFTPAGGVATGYQAVFRSRQIDGPYESRIVLEQGSTKVNGPHQGAWVQTPHGTDWFLHFQELPAYGRVVHLQPMQWRDGWPLMGELFDGERGQPVTSAPAPHGSATRRTAPATSDEFDRTQLGPQWQWQANPQSGWSSLSERRGWLRLRCVPQAGSLWKAAHLLLQKFPAPAFVVTTVMEFEAQDDGPCAGLVLFGYSYAWLGLKRRAGGTQLVFTVCRNAHHGGAEEERVLAAASSKRIHLRVSVEHGALARFSYSTDGIGFSDVGEPVQAQSSVWVGAKIGLFAATIDAAAPAHADFDWFRVTAPGP